MKLVNLIDCRFFVWLHDRVNRVKEKLLGTQPVSWFVSELVVKFASLWWHWTEVKERKKERRKKKTLQKILFHKIKLSDNEWMFLKTDAYFNVNHLQPQFEPFIKILMWAVENFYPNYLKQVS